MREPLLHVRMCALRSPHACITGYATHPDLDANKLRAGVARERWERLPDMDVGGFVRIEPGDGVEFEGGVFRILSVEGPLREDHVGTRAAMRALLVHAERVPESAGAHGA